MLHANPNARSDPGGDEKAIHQGPLMVHLDPNEAQKGPEPTDEDVKKDAKNAGLDQVINMDNNFVAAGVTKLGKKLKSIQSPEILRELAEKAKDRKMKAEKKFYFRIDKIVCEFESKLDKCFLEFEVGGQFKDEKAEVALETKVTKTVTDRQGTTAEREVTEPVFKRQLKIYKPACASFYTRLKESIKAKTPVIFHDHSFDGYWNGTYDDLSREMVTIKIWRKELLGPNILVGRGSELLSNIVNSKMDRELRIIKHTPGYVGGRQETVANVRYKCEFQEKFNYNIDFRDWELTRREPRPEEPESVTAPLLGLCGPPAKRRTIDFVVNRSHATWFEAFLTSAWGMLCFCSFMRSWGDRGTLSMKRGRTSGDCNVRYPGTRSWLEDENLTITLKKYIFCCLAIKVASKDVDLQGILDNGYVATTLDVKENVKWYNYFCGGKQTAEYKLRGVIDSNRIVNNVPLPIFRQLGNMDPSIGEGLGFGFFRKKYTYLVVKVIRAKGLYIPNRDEIKETLNPQVTVEWSGIRKQTRIVRGSSDPSWDDEVHFKIPDKYGRKDRAPRALRDFNPQVQRSTITLSVWDTDNFSRSPLGYCSVDFQDIYYGRRRRKIVAFASQGRQVERLVYDSGQKQLNTPFAIDADSTEAGKKEDATIKGSYASSRHIEFMIYLERADSQAVPLLQKKIKKKKGAAEQKIEIDSARVPLTDDAITRARAFWNDQLRHVPDRHRRFFPFYGKDEYTGAFHFLPTFVKPMQPPMELRKFGVLNYFIYCMECQRKPNLHLLNPSIPRDVWLWADPFFFLEKKKGDLKDHALLLCNFLLGMNQHAYICIGTARTKSKRRVPHMWVMTLEQHNMKNIVRFWETSNGKTYELHNRFTEMPKHVDEDYDDMEDDKPEVDENKEKEDVRRRNETIAALLAAVERAKIELQHAQEDVNEDEPGSNDKVVEAQRKLAAAQEASDAAFANALLTPAQQAAQAQVQAQALAQAQAKNGKNKKGREGLPTDEDDEDFDDSEEELDDIDFLKMSIEQQKMEMGVTNNNPLTENPNPTFSVFDSTKLAQVEVQRQHVQHERQLAVELAMPEFIKEKKEKKHQTPYQTIDVIFNHRHLYANLQNADPELIAYDFGGRSRRWASFKKKHYEEYFGIKKLRHFYPDKGVVSMKAPVKDAEDLENVIIERLKDSVRTHRSYQFHMETVFQPKFDFQMAEDNGTTLQTYMKHRLQHEFSRSVHRPDLDILDSKPQIANQPDDLDAHFDENYVNQKWRPKILADLTKEQIYKERLLHFKHSDVNRIADTVVTKCKDLFEIEENLEPKYYFGCMIHRLAASVCPTRVLVCVIFKKPMFA